MFADGKLYEGYYFNDKKHGYGIYTWTDDKQYRGWWVLGKQDGYGIYLYTASANSKDQSIKYGLWNNGKKMTWLDYE